jgi:hypothetical protein
MKVKLLISSVALLVYPELDAQQACKRISLFFDSDRSELTPASVKKLDSIVAIAAQKQFLVELYGHTDTVGRDAYNQGLSQQRMNSIESYLDGKAKGQFSYKEKNDPETNVKVSRSTEANLAYNRRVDLYLIPRTGNMLQLKGAKPSESVEVPVDYFEPCGLCGSRPEVKSYYSEEDTRGTNITFKTNDGYDLETAGTMMLDYTPCNGVRKKDTAAVIFRICDGKPDEKMSLWVADTINGKIFWKPSSNKFTLDPLTGCYIFRAPAGMLCNLDKIDYDTLYALLFPEEFTYQHAVITNKKSIRYNTREDSIAVGDKDTTCVVHGFGKSGDRVYLMRMRMDSLPDTLHRAGRYYAKSFRSSMQMYQELTYSDTLLKVRTGKFARNTTFGFYLPEYKEFIPMDSVQGKYFIDEKPNCAYQYSYLKGNKLYAINNKSVKAHYAEESNSMRIKFNRKSKRKFRKVPDYKPAQAQTKKAR